MSLPEANDESGEKRPSFHTPPPPTSRRAPRGAAEPLSELKVLVLGVSMTRRERERSALLFVLLLLAAMVLVIGRAARDALFLTHFPVSWIAPMWLMYAVVSSGLSVLYTRALARLPRQRFAVAFSIVAAASYAVVRGLFARDIVAAYAFFYIWSEVIANLVAVLAWTLVQDYHDAQSAKRLFGLIGSGRVLGIVVSGFATSALVRVLGTANLVLVLAVALALFGAIARWLARRHPLPSTAVRSAERALEGGAPRAPLWRSGYVIAIGTVTLVLFVVLTIADYQFKAITRSFYPSLDDLTQFMGFFYGAVGLLGLVVQFFVTPAVLRRFGVQGGMAVLPAAVALSQVALLVWPGVLFAAAVKASDNGLQFSIYEATHQLLFFPFTPLLRERVRLLVGAVLKPAGYAVAALLLLVLAPSAPPGPALVESAARLSWLSAPLSLLSLALLPWVRRGYIDAMRRTLLRREAPHEAALDNPHIRALLREAMRGQDAPQVLFAANELLSIDPEAVTEALPELARHVAAPVRKRAIVLLSEQGHHAAEHIARAALGDADAEVRIAAVEALAQVLREDAHEELLALSTREGDEPVRTAAIAALLRFCGLDGMLDGAPRLSSLLASQSPAERASAARVLGLVGQAQLQRALARLLVDPDAEVRKAALVSAATVADERLLPLLAGALAERKLRTAATKAIVALGEAAVGPLAARLRDSYEPLAVRLTIPRVLSAIGSPAALTVLSARIAEPDVRLRQKVLASASRLRAVLRAPALPHSLVRARIDAEARGHVDLRERYLAVRPVLASRLHDEHVWRRLRKDIVRVLRLCELAYPREVVASVRAHLFGKDTTLRANAFEVLDAVVDRELSARLAGLVERFIALRAGRFPKVPAPPEGLVLAWLEADLQSGETYGAALSFDAAARSGWAPIGPAALRALAHEDPLVREAAAIAVAAARPEGFDPALRALVEDEDPVVRHYARRWLETGRTGLGPEDPMYTTVEKILFLQRVPVFAGVAGEDLAALARGAVVMRLQKGDVVFREGEPGGALYLVISGALRLTLRGREVAELGKSDVFGEMSIFDHEPRGNTATAIEDTELLRVSDEDFHDAVRETVEIAEAVIRELNLRLRRTDKRLSAARAQVMELEQRAIGAAPRRSDAPERAGDDEAREGWDADLE